MSEQRDNSGILFRNHEKSKDTHPDYKGKATIGGREMEMAAWLKDGKKGKFMTFSFSEPRARS